ncbi:hypothetical protein [Alicyclobacillus fodiniaquatilis]|uniref:Uncharacterized protein n=1 Tax=Alicyclobacillus fodiniaquatilis TaxID=1661150 RepID=A0ABW4JIB0_9BACL
MRKLPLLFSIVAVLAITTIGVCNPNDTIGPGVDVTNFGTGVSATTSFVS